MRSNRQRNTNRTWTVRSVDKLLLAPSVDLGSLCLMSACAETAARLPEHNPERACFYHPGAREKLTALLCGVSFTNTRPLGNLEVDDESDFWADHDEDCHGLIDTDEMRKDFPGGFRWDCCDAAGDAEEGCSYDRHEAFPAKRRKSMGEMTRTAVTVDLTGD